MFAVANAFNIKTTTQLNFAFMYFKMSKVLPFVIMYTFFSHSDFGFPFAVVGDCGLCDFGVIFAFFVVV